MHLFFALATAVGLIITFGDTKNVYQQSPPPSKLCYLEINDAYCSWYQKCFGCDIDPRMHVIPLGCAIQGHPEAGVLWEWMLVGILEKNGFQSTTHECNLYCGEIDGKLVLVCHQVNDFAIASKSLSASSKLLAIINKHATTEDLGIRLKCPQGMLTQYNGIDIHQTRDYMKLSYKMYINRVLQTHGWEMPAHQESDCHDLVPLAPKLTKRLTALEGPAEGTANHQVLEKNVGYSYQQVLGKLIYAYVVCRMDITFRPHTRNIMLCSSMLSSTSRAPSMSLPHVPLKQLKIDTSRPMFPKTLNLFQLIGYIDATHATPRPITQ